MAFYDYPPYIPVAQRKKNAAREIARRRKRGETIEPVVIDGRAITRTFWGGAWCTQLESYSDYASRLPRGRSYVKNGSVLNLAIGEGRVDALVQGTELYEVAVLITPLAKPRWERILRACSGKIDSLVELLQGKLSKAVMEVVTDRKDGMFPSPAQISMSCSCPDHATMCKHVAASLYGVGARLDEKPELLFRLRAVDHLALVGTAASSSPAATRRKGGKVISGDDLSSVFGIEIDGGATAPPRGRKTR